MQETQPFDKSYNKSKQTKTLKSNPKLDPLFSSNDALSDVKGRKLGHFISGKN